MSLRLFIAVTPAPEPLVRTEERMRALRELAPNAKWVRPEGLHLTLAFLGATDEERVPDVMAAMDEAASRHPPLNLSLEGGGGFGSPRAPRVLWVGVGGDAPRLMALQADLARALKARGFGLEERGFHAHLTLARSREPRGDRALAGCVQALQGFDAGRGEVPALELFQSTLTPAGSHYALVHASRLGEALESDRG
jgi:RNA 2',3'-cyclic 3'-phosphodiesterase